MQILNLNKDKYVLVDDNDQPRVVVKSELEKQVVEAEERFPFTNFYNL